MPPVKLACRGCRELSGADLALDGTPDASSVSAAAGSNASAVVCSPGLRRSPRLPRLARTRPRSSHVAAAPAPATFTATRNHAAGRPATRTTTMMTTATAADGRSRRPRQGSRKLAPWGLSAVGGAWSSLSSADVFCSFSLNSWRNEPLPVAALRDERGQDRVHGADDPGT